ncbi:MAG: transporter [Thermodesulfovibrionales bacterium]|nr:transporter [Thermodesulfovibrionales bacterium]
MFKIFFIMVAILMSSTAFAGPLITDDTGTLGKGKFQFELKGEYSKDKTDENGVNLKFKSSTIQTDITYGVVDTIDLVFGFPYNQYELKENERVVSKESGVSDLSIDLKWRFYETKDNWSFALKPSLTLPTGKAEKGLGTGKPSYALTFITTKSIEPLLFHFNLAYAYVDYKLQENKDSLRKSIFKASTAMEYYFISNLKAVAEVGIYTNSEKGSNNHPAFVTGGIVYLPKDNIELSVGARGPLNKPEKDLSIIASLSVKI